MYNTDIILDEYQCTMHTNNICYKYQCTARTNIRCDEYQFTIPTNMMFNEYQCTPNAKFYVMSNNVQYIKIICALSTNVQIIQILHIHILILYHPQSSSCFPISTHTDAKELITGDADFPLRK